MVEAASAAVAGELRKSRSTWNRAGKWPRHMEWMRGHSVDAVAHTAVAAVLDAILQRQPTTTLLGVLIVRALRRRFEIEAERAVSYHLGRYMVYLCCEVTGIFTIEHIYDHGSRTKVVPTDEFMEWSHRSTDLFVASYPAKPPMLEPPVDWDFAGNGGYLTLRRTFIIESEKRASAEFTEESAGPGVLAANILQRTAFRIEPRVLDVFRGFVRKELAICGLPEGDRGIPYPPKDHGDEFHDRAYRDWRHVRAAIRLRNFRNRTKRLKANYLADYAREFLDRPLYFPWRADFRGRLYQMPQPLCWQDSKFCRGFLRFFRKDRIDTTAQLDALCAFGAMKYGFRASRADRIEWAKRHEREIDCVASDPWAESFDWWTSAKEPWEFLSWCFEWSQARRVGIGWETDLVVTQDATCHGVQLLALLMRDEDMARRVNLLPTDSIQDIYGEISREVFDESLSRMPLFGPAWKKWIGEPPRDLVKEATLSYPLGLSWYACRILTHLWYRDRARRVGSDPWSYASRPPASLELSRAVWRAVERNMGRTKPFLEWIQDAARISALRHGPMTWTSPSGWRVSQMYLRRWKKGYRNRRLHDEEVCASKQRHVAAGNFVTSIEAGVLHLAVRAADAEGIDQIVTTHDGYGTTARHFDKIHSVYADTLANAFSGDLLGAMYRSLKESVGQDLKPPPIVGNLDPCLTRNALILL